MNERIKRAQIIADAYREEHDGEIPLLVVGHTDSGQELILVGQFRKKHELQDQKMFCSVIRMAFALKGITSYELVIKPVFNFEKLQMTKNVLAIVAIGEDANVAEFFEITDDELVPYIAELPVEGMFTQLLPTKKEREQVNTNFAAKTKKGIEMYVDACSYLFVEKPKTQSAKASGFDALMESVGS